MMILSEFLDRYNAPQQLYDSLQEYDTFEEAWDSCDDEDLIWLATRDNVIPSSTCRRIIYVLIRDTFETYEHFLGNRLVEIANGYDDTDITSLELVSAIDGIAPIFRNEVAVLLDSLDEWQLYKREHATPRHLLAIIPSIILLIFNDRDGALDFVASTIRKWITPTFNEE